MTTAKKDLHSVPLTAINCWVVSRCEGRVNGAYERVHVEGRLVAAGDSDENLLFGIKGGTWITECSDRAKVGQLANLFSNSGGCQWVVGGLFVRRLG